MRRPRFTIGSLLAFVLLSAVAIGALRESTELWDSGVFSFTLVLLSLSVLLTVHRREGARAFWLGFALCGWVYLAASLVPAVGERLITTAGLVYLDSKLPGRDLAGIEILTVNSSPTESGTVHISRPNNVPSVAFSADVRALAVSGPGSIRLWDTVTRRLLVGSRRSTGNFLQIGHAILALVAAFIGAHVSKLLHAQRIARSDPSIGVRLDGGAGVAADGSLVG
jgi:hypothetical protein